MPAKQPSSFRLFALVKRRPFFADKMPQSFPSLKHGPSLRKGRIKARLRPYFLPFAWRRATDGAGLAGHADKRDKQLALDARGIGFRISRFMGQEHVYVPPLLENMARAEFAAIDGEKSRKPPAIFHYPLYRHCGLAALFLLPLLWWHGLIQGWWPAPAFPPSPDRWQTLGALDGIRIKIYGEWHRLGTALCLHSGIPHLAGNLVFGGFFLALLARLIGIGRAFLLTMAGGLAGNFISLELHELSYRSIGYSTALFASIGALGGIALPRAASPQKMFMPLAAALALLAMLGVEGEHTDYAAHLSGLSAGFCLGLWEEFRMRRGLPGLPQLAAGILGAAIPLCAWSLCFGFL